MSKFKRKPYSMITLKTKYENMVSDFLICCSNKHSEIHIMNIRRRCRLFLKCMQYWGRSRVDQVTYDDIHRYDQELSHLKEVSKTIEESSLHKFLKFLAEKGEICHGKYLYMYQLECHEAVTFTDLSLSDQRRIEDLCQMDPCVSAEDYRKSGIRLIQNLLNEGYAEEYVARMEKAILYLYVFLDMNGFSYSYELAIIWLNSDAVKAVICGSSWMAARRVINILHSMLTTDIVDFSHVYRNGISGLDELPSWCRIPLEDFAALRAREKLNDATIKNDIYSILRFLQFLQKQEVHSFDRLTGKIVAEFNLEDHHGTSAGKNTCNARVRRFLKYLYRAGMTQDEKLHFALGSAAASREQIVQVLNNDEIKQIRQYIEAAASPIALRDSAIILLGADMGIRGSDIVSLKLSDIDWRNRRILLSQNKTGVEVCLAMPVSVGNAIFRYLQNGRPRNAESDYVFVSTKTPFSGISRHVCYQTLHRILPDRNVIGSGFHVTRKSFSTNRLRNGISPVMIADAVGHRTTESLTSYLSLDDSNMASCPITLSDLGITMGGRL